jgi:hypothetical protein
VSFGVQYFFSLAGILDPIAALRQPQACLP